ncbi:MAG TPA: ATP-binding cassette domain-containing protein [Streptosporangiaceae bacterium]
MNTENLATPSQQQILDASSAEFDPAAGTPMARETHDLRDLGQHPAQAGAERDGDDAPALHAQGLTKRYGRRTVVDSLDIDIPAGVVAGLVGPNGAGKTTTLRLLLGLVRPSAGGGRRGLTGAGAQPKGTRNGGFIGSLNDKVTRNEGLTALVVAAHESGLMLVATTADCPHPRAAQIEPRIGRTP